MVPHQRYNKTTLNEMTLFEDLLNTPEGATLI